MDGLCRAVAAPMPVLWKGRMRLVSPLRLADLGAIEHYLLSHRESPLLAVLERLDGVPPEARETMVRIAQEEEVKQPNYITPVEFQAFVDTRRGTAMAWWLMLRRHHQVKLEEVEDEIAGMSQREFTMLKAKISLASGISDTAERDWMPEFDTNEDESDKPEKRKRFNWKYAVRMMCEAYMGMTPSDVGEMSLYTFREMFIDAKDVKGRRMTLEQWRAWKAKQGGKSDGR